MRRPSRCLSSAALLAGCLSFILFLCLRSSEPQAKAPAPGERPAPAPPARVIRTRLFQGDAARLEPHFDFQGTACARVEFTGKELPVLIELAVYHNGKRVKLTADRHQEVLHGPSPSEIAFSLRSVGKGADGGQRFCAVTALTGEGVTSSFEFTQPKLKKDTTGRQTHWDHFSEPVELTPGKEVVLWWQRYFGPGNINIDHDLPYEEQAKSTEWGLVFKLSLREWNKTERWLRERHDKP